MRSDHARFSTQPKCDARFGEIVRRHFHSHAVADGEADEVFPHFSRNMRQHFVLIVQGHAKHRARKDRFDDAFEFNRLLITHTKKTASDFRRDHAFCK